MLLSRWFVLTVIGQIEIGGTIGALARTNICARAGSATAGPAANIHLWARLREGSDEGAVPDGVGDQWVAVLDVSRNRDGIGRRGRSTGVQVDLGAVNEELWRAGQVQSGDLRSNQVVAVLEIGRHGDGEQTFAVDELVGAELVRTGRISVLEDLEPTRASTAIAEDGVDFLHVDGARPMMTGIDESRLGLFRPPAELKGSLVSRFDGANTGDAILSVDTCRRASSSSAPDMDDALGRDRR